MHDRKPRLTDGQGKWRNKLHFYANYFQFHFYYLNSQQPHWIPQSCKIIFHAWPGDVGCDTKNRMYVQPLPPVAMCYRHSSYDKEDSSNKTQNQTIIPLKSAPNFIKKKEETQTAGYLNFMIIIEQHNVNDLFQKIMNMTNTKSIHSKMEKETNIINRRNVGGHILILNYQTLKKRKTSCEKKL